MANVSYAENIRNFKLILCSFLEMKKKFFKTTLLDPCTVGQVLSYHKLAFSLTIRCTARTVFNSSYRQIPIKKIVPASIYPDMTLNAKQLFQFKSYNKGTPQDNPLRHLASGNESEDVNKEPRVSILSTIDSNSSELAKHNRIEGWAENIMADADNDEFQKSHIKRLLSISSNLAEYQSCTTKGTSTQF